MNWFECAVWTRSGFAMKIPYTELSEDALAGIIEEYVSREGTEYGDREFSLQDKVTQVKAQLQRGEVMIDFDPESETCHLIPVAR